MDIINITIILLTTILFLLAYLINDWTSKSSDYWTSKGIPCLSGKLPIFGHGLSLLSLKKNISVSSKIVYDMYKNNSMLGFYNLKNPILMVRDPELVKTILQTGFNNFQNNSITIDLNIDPLIGRDPFFLRGSEWKKSKDAFSSVLTAKRIKNMTPIVINVCNKLENYLSTEMENKNYLDLEMKFLFSRFTSETAAGTVFSMDGNSFASDYNKTFLDHMKIMLDVTKITMLKQLIVFFLPWLSKIIKARIVPPEVDRYFCNIIEKLDKSRQKNGFDGNDVLQQMREMKEEGKIDNIDVIAYSFNFFLLSYETTSIALSFMSYVVAKHEEVQERVRKEVEMVSAKYENSLTYEAINEMVYLDQVMKETFRIYPPAGVISKICTEPYRLDGHDGLSLKVEPGTTVLIPILGLHMDSEYWEEPEKFDPERFEQSKTEARNKFIYLPFGIGLRSCPSQRFVAIELKAAIATIVRNYRLEIAPKMIDPLRLHPGTFILRATGGVWIRLRPLNK